jgi:adenylyltransferase/sulfurtransferase
VPGREETKRAAAEQSAWEIGSRELKQKLDRQEVALIDVREPHEWEICRIPGASLVPLGELPNRLAELPLDRDLVLHCHKGVRSMRALSFLRDHVGRLRCVRGACV